MIVFYASLREVRPSPRPVYALIGLYVIDAIVPAISVPHSRWHENAHTRRVLSPSSNDIVVRAKPGVSGRLERCLPIGDFRERAYRVWPDLLKRWGGLSAKNGYLPELWVIERVEAAGFKLAEKSEINANPKDTKDHPEGVWTLPPTYRLGDKDHDKYAAIGESDRMTLKFVKVTPAAAKK